MAQKVEGGLPPQCDLGGGWVLEFHAANPTDGSDVANVKVSNIGIMVELLTAPPPGQDIVGPYMLVPGPEA